MTSEVDTALPNNLGRAIQKLLLLLSGPKGDCPYTRLLVHSLTDSSKSVQKVVTGDKINNSSHQTFNSITHLRVTELN